MLRRTAIRLTLVLWLTAFAPSHSYAEGKDACALISKSDVESILGKAVVETRLDYATIYQNPKGLSMCRFEESGHSRDPAINLNVSYSPPAAGESPDQVRMRIEKSQSTTTSEDVPGIGDVAIWSTMPTFNPSQVHSDLYVFKGTMLLTISVSLLPADAAFAGAKQLALKALAASGETSHLAANMQSSKPALTKPALDKLGEHPSQVDLLRHSLDAKAEAGNAQAQLALGLLYQYGTAGADGIVHPDNAGAAYWYQKSSNNGDPEGAYAMALL